MRTTSIITISLPPKLAAASEKIAREKHMTRSELMRTALRNFIEEHAAAEAIAIYKKELREGKLKELKDARDLFR